jgi:hypothetical protein
MQSNFMKGEREMSRRFTTACVLATLILAGSLAWGACWDDQSFFTVNVRPRAMIVLDRSGSMDWCFDGSGGCGWGNPNQRLTAAVQAIFGVLDADSNGVVNNADELALGVDLGYSEYWNATPAVPYSGDVMGTHYATIWSHVNRYAATNGTPCALTGWNAYNYVRTQRSLDPLAECRPYFIIMMTDGGSNTDGCGDPTQGDDSRISGRYMEKNESWTARNDRYPTGLRLGIPFYWVGMGSTMPLTLRNTLNWAAFLGGTDDPTTANAGDTSRCWKTLLGSFPDCNIDPAQRGPEPGGQNLSGYAFIGNNGAVLGNALKTIFKQIQQSGGQTFAMSTLPANFSKGALYYWSSFMPLAQPKWLGSVTALKFDSLGNPPFDSLTGNLDTTKIVWDAGNLLRKRDINTDPRTIYTWTGAFKRTLLNDYTKVLPETLGYAAGDTTNQRKTVRFVYGDSVSGGHTWGWLNDPFHGYTVEVKNPSWIYLLGKPSYTTFRTNYQNRPARLYAMVNDGQLHCFNADTLGAPPYGGGQGGKELWSFVPRHMLTRLGAMRSGHTYNMDGPLVMRHIFAYADSNAVENWYDWRSIIVGGERTGGRYYFAMDVTDPTGTEPLAARRPYPYLMWEVGPSTTNGPENLSDMGYTWSTPTIWKMRILTPSATHRPDTSWVVVVGGGYDCQDLSKGHFIAVLDAFSGQLIRKLTLGAGGGPVAAPVTLADFDKDGKVDHLYAGDLYGNVWRWDVSDSNAANWQRKPNAAFFTDLNNRPIYGGISLGPTATVGDSSWIYFGTGDRDNPIIQPNNRFYGLKDPKDDNAFPMAHLVDVTNANNCGVLGLMGWFKSIPADTEAVFTMPVTAVNSDSVYTLGWKYPNSSGGGCSSGSAGTTYLYSFFKTCGYSDILHPWRRVVATGMAPGEIPHGIDRRGRHQGVAVTQMFTLETYLRGKIVKSWREVY